MAGISWEQKFGVGAHTVRPLLKGRTALAMSRICPLAGGRAMLAPTQFVLFWAGSPKIDFPGISSRPSHKKCRMESKRSESRRAESIWDLIEAFLW